ncbi:MATE family efflux transporter [Acuticoccus sp. I52.16.1]|uniref:MATE family efflux transporter n=1 Tax=Acuticoccus sp. I52.16.1 TaxID=2928472 RepID=UPI001FD123A4|nr:MATE family efflux transporter [Acuticoccus sp. I52.16.1]UOM35223.1 MATE family efflux transporter [Acuticoccus sp. I52.16.1]
MTLRAGSGTALRPNSGLRTDARPVVPPDAPGPVVPPTPTRMEAAALRRAARTRVLLEGPIGPTLARLAAPNVLAMLVSSVLVITEAVFAGQLGISALAGLALVFPLVMLVQMMSAGAMGGAISSAVSRALGAGDPARAAGLAVTAWAIGLVAALIFALAVVGAGRTVFGWLGGDGAAVEAAYAYALVFFPGCLTYWLLHGTLSVMRGTGNMLAPACTLLAVAVATVPISGALSLGWGPFPALGMAGLAAGLVIAHGLAAIGAVLYVLAGRAGLTIDRAAFRLRRDRFADILRVGLIASLNALQSVATIVIMVALVGRFGPEAMAGYGLGARLEFLMIPVVFGIGAAMTAMVGANIGAGARARALRIGFTGALAAGGAVGCISLTLALFPDLWLGLFLSPADTAVLEAGRLYFRIVAPFLAFFALGLALYFASQGAGRMIWPVAASFVRMGVAFGGALALVGPLGLGGIFVGVAAGMLVYGAMTAAAILATRWR